jgi:hypothetical protein
VVQVPGILGWTRVEAKRELVRGNFAQYDRTGFAKLADDSRVLGRNEVLAYLGTSRRADTLSIVDVLDSYGHAVQRPTIVAVGYFLLRLSGGADRVALQDRKKGQQLRIDPCDAIKYHFRQRDRR